MILSDKLEVNVTLPAPIPVSDLEISAPDTGFMSGVGDFVNNLGSLGCSFIILLVVALAVAISLFLARHKFKNTKLALLASLGAFAFAASLAFPAIAAVSEAVGNLVTLDVVAAEPTNYATATTDLEITEVADYGVQIFAYTDTDNTLYNADKTSSIIPTNATSSLDPTGLDHNSYGLSFMDNASDVIENYYTSISTDPTNPTLVYSTNDALAIGDHVELTYAVSVDQDFPVGSYTSENDINYEIKVNPTPTFSGITTMQAMTTTICANETTPSASTTETTDIHLDGDITKIPVATLEDTRDNKTYTIAKLADGNCWMTQNLAIGDTTNTYTLNSTNSDLSTTDPDFIITPSDVQTSGTDSWACNSDVACEAKHIYATDDESYGNLYPWYTATANTGKYDTPSAGQDAPSSICPKGWKLPTGQNYDNAQLKKLYITYGEDGSKFRQVTNFAMTGYYWIGVKNQGNNGYWWSSTAKGVAVPNGSAQNLNGTSSDIDPAYYSPKYYGNSMRCVAVGF